MREEFVRYLLEAALSDESIMLLTADLGFGVLDDFAKCLPRQFLNTGVSEQNMMSVAAALALDGFKVFTYSIGNFGTMRCLEQIRLDVAYHNAPVTVVAVGAGFSYGPLGVSHHALEDLAIFRAMQGISTYAPGTVAQVGAITRARLEASGPAYLRLDKTVAPDLLPAPALNAHGWELSGDVTSPVHLVATGGILKEALGAQERLLELGIRACVWSAFCLDFVDQGFTNACRSVSLVVTIEEGVRSGGLFGLVCETLADADTKTKIVGLGLGGEFEKAVGSREYLIEVSGVSQSSIVDAVSIRW